MIIEIATASCTTPHLRKLLADEIVAAWAKAGSELGWITLDSEEELTWRGTNVEPQVGFLPAFRFREQFLARMPQLKKFTVGKSQITQSGFNELKQVMPEAKEFP